MSWLIEDLAFRFQISPEGFSQIWITWLKLMSVEHCYLIILPLRGQIFATLPQAFRRLYQCVIINYSGVFGEIPSSLEAIRYLWINFKHHHMFKFLVVITPNSVIFLLSPCFGGCTSDIIIVRDSGFSDLIQTCDTVLAACSFKVESKLTLHRFYLAIPQWQPRGLKWLPEMSPQLVKWQILEKFHLLS